MRHTLFICVCVCCMALLGAWSPVPAQAAEGEERRIALPKPETTGGMSLREALTLRKSTRGFSGKAVPQQELSNLLWAAWGVNRPSGLRTIPTSNNKQSELVYVALEDGVWLYDANKNELALALEGDFRAKLGGAPVTLIYASIADFYASGMHVGALYQNAGLYCASAGLGNLVRRSGADSLDGVLKLPAGYKVFIIQSVGWPN